MMHGKVIKDYPYSYEMNLGESLVKTSTPPWRANTETDGLIRPRWNGEKWTEGAATKEVAAWEKAHPAPDPAPAQPTEMDILRQKVDTALIELAGGLADQEAVNQDQDTAIMEIGGMISG